MNNSCSRSLNRSLDRSCYFLEINLDVPLYVFIANITVSVINGATSIVAVTVNTLVLIVMWKTPALHTAGNVLLGCLAFSDLVVGLVSQPAYILYKTSENRGEFRLLCITQLIAELTGWTASGVSLLTVTAIGVERYISLYRPLTFTALITTRRAFLVVVFFWIGLILREISRFWFLDSTSASYLVIISIIICLGLSLWSSWKIYSIAVRHQNSVRDIARVTARLHGQNFSQNTRRERKVAVAVLGVFLLFLICYCPIMCCLIVFQTSGLTTQLKAAFTVSATLSYVNGSLNPVWYCWRIGEIRRAIRKLLFTDTVMELSTNKTIQIRASYICRNEGLSFDGISETF